MKKKLRLFNIKFPGIFWFFIGGVVASLTIFLFPPNNGELVNGIISWTIYAIVWLVLENKVIKNVKKKS